MTTLSTARATPPRRASSSAHRGDARRVVVRSRATPRAVNRTMTTRMMTSRERERRGETTTTTRAENGDGGSGKTLEERIASGEFTKASDTGPFRAVADGLRKLVPEDSGPVGRGVSLSLARLSRRWRSEAMSKMPVAVSYTHLTLPTT